MLTFIKICPFFTKVKLNSVKNDFRKNFLLYFCAKVHKKTQTFVVMDAKMFKNLIYLILIVPFYGFAQVTDDFSDGDFTANPMWIGTESLFVVNSNKQLQLNAEEAGEAWLFCEEEVSTGVENGEYEWHFWLREAFSPSGNNFSDVYLCDRYFVRFGEAGSNDVVDLQRVDGCENVSVCRGTDTFIASSFSAFFKVTRDSDGNWKIFVDKDGNGDYRLETQGVDNTYEPFGNFGIKAKYSGSNSKKVYLDDVYAGPLIVDSEAPCLNEIIVLKYNKLELDFNEPVDAVYALSAENYHLDNQIGVPMYAEYNGNNRSSLILSFSKTIQEGVNYTLTINKIQDVSGNLSENVSSTFIFYNLHENDVVINEIMADPEPSVGLPPYEYVELYNTTDHDINMKDWTFVIGTSEKTITRDITIEAEGFIILCKEESVPFLSEYGDCVGFTSFSIPNSGSLFSLYGFHKFLVFELDFNKSWYRDNEKSDGGWSLEQIDPHSPCLEAANWRASCDKNGGTPGAVNSVVGEITIAPDIDYVNVLSSNSIEVVFNQKMDSLSLANTDNYTIVEFNAHPYLVQPSKDKKSATLLFQQEIIFHKFHKILVFGSNCSGVPVLDGCSCVFGIPEEAVGGDVVINEILFDPISPAADYVELYNKSDKTFNINRLRLGVVKSSFPNLPDTTLKTICSEGRQLMPGSYLLLTTTPDVIGYQYECPTDNFITMKSFPSYPNGGATVLLCFGDEIIDCMSYSDDSHYPLLTETKGVALERVSPDISSWDSDNWHSAAAPLYGTPGYQNSVFIENTSEEADIEISPPVFSPDGDGFDDITTINLSCFQNDFTAKIIIFDSHGMFVRDLVNCQNIASQSRFVWNGLDENGKIVPSGIYVVFTEVFDTQGNIKRFKKAVVVAEK